MTQEEANAIVKEYQETGHLPDGFEADHSSHDSIQGNELEVVYIRQGEATKISYTVENGEVQEVDLV